MDIRSDKPLRLAPLPFTGGGDRLTGFRPASEVNEVQFKDFAAKWKEKRLTSPAMGVGNLLTRLTMPGLILLIRLRGEKERGEAT